MFTGIIEEIGSIVHTQTMSDGVKLRIAAPRSIRELEIKDSIAINGVCLTVTSLLGETFETDAVAETLKKTSLGSLQLNSSVNLELPMRLNERLGGHIVLGHVDAVGEITQREDRGNSWMFAIRIPKELMKYLIPVGSVAIDGVSLTVAELHEDCIRVSIIPHTMENTIFKQYKIGHRINLEFDVLGKYIERLLSERSGTDQSKPTLTETDLREMGY